MDRRLIERTIEVAVATGAFGARPRLPALDSSPLWGASRVEDTYNLLGHALRKALDVIARRASAGAGGDSCRSRSWTAERVEFESGLGRGTSDDPGEQARALSIVLGVLNAVEGWLDTHPAGSDAPVVGESLATAKLVKQQDVEITEAGTPGLRDGVAKDRRISVEDAQMRHGRKSRSIRVDGYKRHVLHDLDTGLVRAVGLTAANAPEASVTEPMRADLACQRVVLP